MVITTHRSYGFTIVELLIVIVVIGILAAIVVVAYQGVTNRANDAAVQADLRGLANKIAIFQVDGAYPTATQTDLEGILRVNKKSYYIGPAGTLTYCRSDDGYAVYGRSASKQAYVYSSNGGLQKASYLGDVYNQCLAGGIDTGVAGGGTGPGDPGADQIRLLRGQGDTSPGWLSWIH